MSHVRFRPKIIASIVWLVISLALLSVLPMAAQTPSTIQPGTAVVGNIASEGTTVVYSFTATGGDLIEVNVIAVSPGMNPNVTLLGSQQETLASNEDALSDLPTTNAELVFRAAVADTYTLVVGGTPGDFLLTLNLQPIPAFIVLELDAPTEVRLPLQGGQQFFAFNTDPFAATSVLFNAAPFDLGAFVTIRDGSGRVAAMLQGNLENACFSFGPGDLLHELIISAPAPTTGTLTVTLGRGPCQLGAAPQTPSAPAATPQFPPATIEGVCAASAFNVVNVRSGPGLQFPVLALAFARQPLQVIGRSEDGFWLAVQIGGIQGWVAAPVVVLAGPCDQLPIVPAPAVTPTPMATTAGATPTEATPEVTATTEPTQTPTEGTPEVTPTTEPTQEPTPEVTQPTG